MIYLLHFTPRYRHAGHYLGSSDDVEHRVQEHQLGRADCRLTRAAAAAGVRFTLAQVWPGGRAEEGRLKGRDKKKPHPSGRRTGSRTSLRKLCAICKEAQPDV
jgi:predicted GIY-YIG superfamily endonuclease